MANEASVVQFGARVSYEKPLRRDNPLKGMEGFSLAATPRLPVQLFVVFEGGERLNSEPGFSVDLPKGAGRPVKEMIQVIKRACLELAKHDDRVLLRDLLDPRDIEIDWIDFEEIPFEVEIEPELEDRLRESAAAG